MPITLSDFLAVVIGVAILLFYLNYAWFVKYLEIIYAGLRTIVRGLEQIGALLLRFTVFAFRSSLKLAIFLGTMLGIVVLYLATLPASLFGTVVQSLNNWTQRFLNTSKTKLVADIRDSFVEIAAEYQDREARFDSGSEYREEIIQVPESTKSKLENGELVLSLTVAGTLITMQLQQIPIGSVEIAGYAATLLVEGYLVVLAISVLYRISIIDMLSYDRSVDFDDLDKWDAAYGYQRAVAFKSVVGILMMLIVVGLAVTKARLKTVVEVLEAQREEDLSTRETMDQILESQGEDDDE